MADRTPDNPDLAVDELKRKARRRLVGAVVLALAAAIVLPMLLEKEPRPLGEDVSVRIPPVDGSRLVRSPADKGTGPVAGAPTPAPDSAPAKTESDAPLAIAAPKEKAPAKSDAPGTVDVPAKADVSAKVDAASRPGGSPPIPPSMAPSGAPRADVPTGAKSEPSPSAPTAARAAQETVPKKSIADVEQQMLSPTRKPTSGPAAAEAGLADATRHPPASAAQASSSSAVSAPTAASATGASNGVPAAAPAVAAVEGYVVQLAAFADDKGANALAGRLKKGGYAAYVEPVQTSRGTLWRVRIGGHPTRGAADAAREKLKTEGHNGIVVPAR